MLKDDILAGKNRVSNLGGSLAIRRPNLPDGVVDLFAKHVDLLVTGESSI